MSEPCRLSPLAARLARPPWGSELGCVVGIWQEGEAGLALQCDCLEVLLRSMAARLCAHCIPGWAALCWPLVPLSFLSLLACVVSCVCVRRTGPGT